MRKLAFQDINLGYRIKKVIQIFESDNWFIPPGRRENSKLNFHEEAYQLSFTTRIGGSEKIIDEINNT